MRPRGRGDIPQRIQRKEKINQEIVASKVRVISDPSTPDTVPPGVYSVQEALEMCSKEGLDLVEVVPGSDPCVCRVVDYGRYVYLQQKKKREVKKTQKVMGLKEIKMRPKTDVHDYSFKLRHVRDFLVEGNRVKITVRFKGRELSFLDSGREQMEKVLKDTEDIAKVESRPSMEGRAMVMVLVPKKVLAAGGKENEV